MILTTLICLPLRYAEGYLGATYRKSKPSGMISGAFYYFEKSKRPIIRALAPVYAVLCLGCALLGMGTMVQSRSVADAVLALAPGKESNTFIISAAIGIVMSVLFYICVHKGVSRIGDVVSVVVPFMLIAYCLCGAAAIVFYKSELPAAFSAIFKGAFSGSAAIGGFGGAALKTVISSGISKGVFTNESGLGTAAFAAGASKSSPASAGFAQMGVAIIDTVIVCSVSALAIITSGAYKSNLSVTEITAEAFSLGGIFPAGGKMVYISTILFAFMSALGVYFYGRQSLRYLTGGHGVTVFNLLFAVFIFAGCVYPVMTIWNIADILNGLMAFLNLPALISVAALVKSPFGKRKKEALQLTE